MESTKYVHGYSNREALRLNDQADTLDYIVHNDTIFPKDSFILEAGCGVGAQLKATMVQLFFILIVNLHIQQLIARFNFKGKVEAIQILDENFILYSYQLAFQMY